MTIEIIRENCKQVGNDLRRDLATLYGLRPLDSEAPSAGKPIGETNDEVSDRRFFAQMACMKTFGVLPYGNGLDHLTENDLLALWPRITAAQYIVMLVVMVFDPA
ncbi:MAG: hypothetical protein K2P80_03530 [Beijerinckiaceae bacterium]|nr:hypothetical protein [Beijerinckiaceae bacterium]